LGIQYTSMVSQLSQERHKPILFRTSIEQSYLARSRTQEAGLCRPSTRAGTNNIRKETSQGDLIEGFKIVTGREKVKMEDIM